MPQEHAQPSLPNAPVFDLDHWMIAWNPPRIKSRRETPPGSVEVGPWPDETGWSDRYISSSGCCYARWEKLTKEQKLREIVNGFFVLVLGDGLDPAAVHRELWKINAYRDLEMGFLGHGPYIIFQGEGRCDPYNP